MAENFLALWAAEERKQRRWTEVGWVCSLVGGRVRESKDSWQHTSPGFSASAWE